MNDETTRAIFMVEKMMSYVVNLWLNWKDLQDICGDISIVRARVTSSVCDTVIGHYGMRIATIAVLVS